MSVFLDISAALDGHLNDMIGLPPVAWENTKFETVNGVLYLRPTLITGDTVQATLGESGTDRNDGIYQVDIIAKAGEGKNEAIVMADNVADQFKRGTDLVYNSRVVRVRNVGRRVSTVSNDGWYIIIVEISYISFTQPRT